MTVLNIAVYQNDITLLKAIIDIIKTQAPEKLSLAINQKDLDGTAPIVIALSENRLTALDILLENGANINERCASGHSLMSIATKSDSYEPYEILLKYGANINGPINLFNTMTTTPLCQSILKNNKKLFKYLLENSADLNKRYNSNPYPLFIALRQDLKFQKIDYAAELILAGANCNIIDQNGKIPLLVATEYNKNKAFDLLLPKTNCLVKLTLAIELAASLDNVTFVEKIYKYAQENSIPTEQLLQKAFQKSVLKGSDSTISFCVGHNVSVDCTYEGYGFNVLSHALINNNPQSVQSLLHFGANPLSYFNRKDQNSDDSKKTNAFEIGLEMTPTESFKIIFESVWPTISTNYKIFAFYKICKMDLLENFLFILEQSTDPIQNPSVNKFIKRFLKQFQPKRITDYSEENSNFKDLFVRESRDESENQNKLELSPYLVPEAIDKTEKCLELLNSRASSNTTLKQCYGPLTFSNNPEGNVDILFDIDFEEPKSPSMSSSS